MGEIVIQGRKGRCWQVVHLVQGPAGNPRTGEEVFRQCQVGFMGLTNLGLPRGALGLILGPRALDPQR